MRGGRWASYDGGVVAAPRRVVAAVDARQLAEVVRDEAAYPGPVRAVGSFHSLTPCPVSAGTMIDMTPMARVLEVDTQRMTVTAQAGVQVVQAARLLRRRGLQLPLNIEIGNMTLGSAACCHSKDGLDGGQLNSLATRVRWVDADGADRTATEADDPDLLYFLRSSYGLAGVVTEVTFPVKPVETVWLNYHVTRLDRITQGYVDDVLGRNQGVVVWSLGRTVVFQTRNRYRDGDQSFELGAGFRRRAWNFWSASVAQRVGRMPAGLRRVLGSLWLGAARLGYRALDLIGGFTLGNPSKIVDYSRTPPSARYAFTFWTFPRAEWLDNLREYQEFADAHDRRTGFRCLLPLGSYFVRRDRRSLLSYSHDGDTVSLDPIHAPSAADRGVWVDFLREFNGWASARGGVPLLNQSPLVERAHAERAYGRRWAEFGERVRRADPRGRFRNEFFDRLLGEGAATDG